jgi:uncharacterized cysteine cluster protein YcgN (CxxCxxCC family)
MSTVAIVPRTMREKKPAHGARCNRCGLCCFASLCDAAQAIFQRKEGPCPVLLWDKEGSRCGLVEFSEGDKRDAIKLLINAANGCDMVLHGEQRDHAYTQMLDMLDFENRHRIEAARKLWGLI